MNILRFSICVFIAFAAHAEELPALLSGGVYQATQATAVYASQRAKVPTVTLAPGANFVCVESTTRNKVALVIVDVYSDAKTATRYYMLESDAQTALLHPESDSTLQARAYKAKAGAENNALENNQVAYKKIHDPDAALRLFYSNKNGGPQPVMLDKKSAEYELGLPAGTLTD